MNRITESMLQKKVDLLNQVAGRPMGPYTRTEDGRLAANVGNFHVSGAYGGWTLHCMHNTSGGVSTPLNCGYISRRALYDLVSVYIAGWERRSV
jgi:hypothetical protein